MIKFASLFSDKAVLQRRIWLPVWGTSVPQHMIKITIADCEILTKCGRDGNFTARIAPLEAGGPYTLSATDLDDGSSCRCVDVMIGDVWLCSGQSNMWYHLNQDWSPDQFLPEEEKVNNTNRRQLREFLDTIEHPEVVRYFTVPGVATGCEESSVDGSWVYLDRENAPMCSACGAWFSRYLREKEDIPIGLLLCSLGGAIVETWTSRGMLMSDPDTAQLVETRDYNFAQPCAWEEPEKRNQVLLEKFCPNRDTGTPDMKFAQPDLDDSTWGDFSVPGSWITQNVCGNAILWARKSIMLPKSWQNCELRLELGGIDKTDITYFNGVEIGRTGSGFATDLWQKPRKYTVPATLTDCDHCVIAVRAFSFLYDGSFNGSEKFYALVNPATGERIELAGMWKTRAEVDFGKTQPPGEIGGPYPQALNTPSILFDAMLRPVIPYGITGVIWYQGESNGNNIANALEYRKRLAMMIRDWRFHWGQGNFPFIQVELAAFHAPQTFQKNSAWAPLRESQRFCCRDLDNVFIVSAIDIGDAKELHPQNKREVGRRLALAALHEVYHHTEIVPCGPLFERIRIEGKRVRIEFSNASGLHFKDGIPRGFFVGSQSAILSGARFFAADKVTVEGSSVVVSATACETPAFVRYSWADNPDGNLYNGAGLPASPFRSDTLCLQEEYIQK